VYSETNRDYCFSCRLFSILQIYIVLNGCCGWKHLPTVLHKYKESKDRRKTMSRWFELEQRLLEGKAIDYENELRIQEAKKHWQDLMERLPLEGTGKRYL
jgi:hypothetical protein